MGAGISAVLLDLVLHPLFDVSGPGTKGVNPVNHADGEVIRRLPVGIECLEFVVFRGGEAVQRCLMGRGRHGSRCGDAWECTHSPWRAINARIMRLSGT